RGRLMRALVIGGGTMGRGIAQLLALHGNEVALGDSDDARTKAAIEGAAASLGRAAERGRITVEEARAATALITPDDGAEPEIAIEAVFEDLALKRELAARLDERLPPGAILATNTSSLSIGSIAEGLAGAERVIGMHFFNPPVAMPLIEIVCGDATSGDVVERTRAL